MLKAYLQDKMQTVQRKACNLWNIFQEKEKQDKSNTIGKDTLANLRKECLQSKSKVGEFGYLVKLTKTHTLSMFAATKSNVADNAIAVEDDSTASGSSKKCCSKRDNEKESPDQNKLKTKLAEINDELASYTCIRKRTGLSDEYKKRVQTLTSKMNEGKKKLKRKIQDIQSQHRLPKK